MGMQSRGLGLLWSKTYKPGMVLFAITGFVLLAVGAYKAASTLHFLAVAESAEGQVVYLEQRNRSDGSGVYYPVVRFRTVGGQDMSFTGGVGSRPPVYTRGEAVPVLYDPTAPQGARIYDFIQLWAGPASLGSMGGIFSLVGVCGWVWIVRRNRPDAWLDRHGERIIADIVDVTVNFGTTVRGQNPWRIRAQWREPGRPGVFIFNSGDVWFDPKPFLQNEKIEVVIDRQNPSRYRVDLSFLPKQAA